MNNIFLKVSVVISLTALATGRLLAQAGNDNPTGNAGELEGQGIITTGCHYDTYTGSARRTVTDLVVDGGVGAYPLEFTRTSNSRYSVGDANSTGGQNGDFGPAGNWLHSYQWTIDVQKGGGYTVSYPDGRVVTFKPTCGGGGNCDPYYRGGTGVRDRLQVIWDNSTAGRAYLIMPDGGKVWFSIGTLGGIPNYKVQGIIDPYGQTTTIVGSFQSGLVTITEPGGRWIKLYYISSYPVYVIDHITASDGRSVQYTYTGLWYDAHLTQVTYFNDPNLVATYTYQAYPGQNDLLRTCVDPMYAGPMWKIAYNYATGTNPDGTSVVYGQIRSENYFDGTNIGAAVSTLTINTKTTRTETRGDGKTRAFTYNTTTPPLLINWTDFKANSASQTYDSNGYVNSVTDFNGHTTNFTKNAFTGGLLTKTFPSTPGDTPPGTPRGLVSYTYGSASCADPNNRDTNNPYYICTATDEGGHATTFTRDTNKRVTQINYPDGGTESFQYNSFGQVTSHTMRTGGVETFEYDVRGLKQKYRDPYHANGNATAWYSYDGLDRVIGVTDAFGASTTDWNHTISYSYNVRGQLLVATLPIDPIDNQRHTIQRSYNSNGNGTLTSLTDQLGYVTSYTYDDFKRVKSVTTPGHNTPLTSTVCYASTCPGDDYTYTDANLLHAFSPSHKESAYVYDENRRRLSVTVAPGTSDAATSSYTYDAAGNVVTIRSPNQQPGKPFANTSSSFSYDERNRRMSATDALGNVTTFKYDAAGRSASMTRANGQLVTYDSYDAMNRLLQQTVKETPDPDAITKYTYYTSGLLQTMKDPRLIATNSAYAYSHTYDLMGRKTASQYPPDSYSAQRTESWHYDVLGRMDLFTNRAGTHETLTYDNLNRLTDTSWDDVPATPGIHNTYDVASRVTGVTNANATIVRALFHDGLLNSETTTYADSTPRTVTYNYDDDSNRRTITYPAGVYSFTYGYTGRNQVQDLLNTATSANIAHYVYDSDGNLANRSPDNATSTSLTYDALDRITHITHALNGTTRTFDYGYDSVNNPKWTKRDGGAGDVYGYDLNDQSISVLLNVANPDITSPGSQTIVYDANGNRTTFSAYGPTDTYTIDNNSLNQYHTRNSNAATYNVNGNMTTGLDLSVYTYDAQNRVLTASKAGISDSFAYDGINRQVKRTVGGGAPVYNVYDGWNLIAEYPSGSTVPNNAYLSCVGGIVKNIVTNRYYYQDARASTSHLADNAGTLLEWYRYDLQGKPFFCSPTDVQCSAPSSNSNYSVRHLYTGQQWYGEIGLYDLRNRFYSPDIGRFLQVDPTGFSGDPTNLYRYARNSPLKWRDPTGLQGAVADEVRVTAPDNYQGPIGGSWELGNPIEFTGVGLELTGEGNLSGIGNAAGPWFGDIPSAFENGAQLPPNPFNTAVSLTLGPLPLQPVQSTTYFLGLNISLITPLGGFTLGYGYYVNFTTMAIGTYYTYGTGEGVSGGPSVDAGYVNGTEQQFKGAFDNLNLHPWFIDYGRLYSPSNGYLGDSFGVGYPPWGWSRTSTTTGLLPIDYPRDELVPGSY